MVKHSVRTALIVTLFAAMLAFVGQSFVMAQTPTPTATATVEVEIVGIVTAVTSQSITIGSQTFDISTAEIKASITVGSLVKIHATQVTTGQWVAREVELARPTASQTPTPQSPEVTPDATIAGEFEITGFITDFNDNSIVIAGQVIDISNAEIKDALTANNLVKVHVSIVDGVWVASEVETATNRLNPNGTPVATLQGNDGRHGQDDGPGNDLNDDHGGNNNNDDRGGNNGNNNNGNNNSNDDHDNRGNNNGENNNSSGGSNNDDNSGHGGGGDDSGGGHGHG
ncbi:MAG: hypothetical protein GC179_19170 [Anaerolineaceae bacterium]|nr:hypothetical protein [Anaerolineaceae bacterium]